MRRLGGMTVGLLATVALLALLAISPGTAAAIGPITPLTVNEETSDARLAPVGDPDEECISESAEKGCTLRAAVELANYESREDDIVVTIDVPAGTFGNTEEYGTFDIEVGARIVITGEGAGKTNIEGAGEEGTPLASIFTVDEGASLTIQKVTLLHGYAEGGSGGAIDAEGGATVTVEDSALEENGADKYGGGIYAEEGAYVSVKESKITKNRAGESGGGIYSAPYAQVVVDRSTIANNEAEYDGGGIAAFMAEEICEELAARHSKRSGRVRPATVGDEPEVSLSIDQSTVEHNSAEYGGGILTYDEQGECRDTSGKRTAKPQAALFLEPSLSIDQSTIAYNRAEEIDEEGGYGGGIYEEGFFEDPITNSTIADNFATNDGGGAAIAFGASVALISDTVFDNTVEPEEIEIQAKRVRRALHRDVVEGTAGPGNNLATDEDYAYVGLRNTIVAEPSASVENCEGNFESLVEKAGYNLDYPSKALPEGTLDSCGMSAEEQDLVGEAPGLDEEAGLASNGGPTQTIALLSSSPAIGFVPLEGDCDESENGPASVDQRGVTRPGIPGKGCDVGAYEYQEPPAKPVEAKPAEAKPAEAKTEVLSVKIVSPVQCASQRDITIHIQNVKQLGIVSAVVSIDGKAKRTLTGKRLTTAINLRGLPKGTFTIEIVARTRSGRTLRGKRVYHTCHTKLPGHSYLPL